MYVVTIKINGAVWEEHYRTDNADFMFRRVNKWLEYGAICEIGRKVSR